MLKSHPLLVAADPKPTLDRVISIVTPDLESQDHILQFQVPVAVKQFNVGLIIVDSVAANYRAEFERPGANRNGANMAKRSAELIKLGAFLRSLAQTHNLAVVVANQVGDRFTSTTYQASNLLQQIPARFEEGRTLKRQTQPSPLANRPMAPPPLSSAANPSSSLSATAEIGLKHGRHRQQPMGSVIQAQTSPPMTLDHQQRWFTGWGDDLDRFSVTDQDFRMLPQKTPSLGLVWTSQIAARIALIKTPIYGQGEPTGDDDEVERGEQILRKWRRYAKVVFAPWAKPTGSGIEGAVEFEIGKWGIRSLQEAPNGVPILESQL